MAYTVVMTKDSVSQVNDVIYSISIRTVVNDGVSDVFDQTFSVQFNTNSADMEQMKDEYLDKVKDAWDKFAAEQGIYTAPAFDAAVTSMQSQAQTYVNS